MTSQEVTLKMRHLVARRRDLHEKATVAARSVVPVLIDSGRKESARPLQEAFFELDALDQEMAEFVRSNLDQVMESLLRNVR